ncbi:MAG: HAMP domain-containing histidine kinase [Hyphomonadaceae bacterium]|nr:HAMP domain-containing histidine kinase [Hyphomonadaceae bacterium]
MRRWRLLRLRTQLALAMIVCVLATFAFGYASLSAYGTFRQSHYIELLSPHAAQAFKTLRAGGTPSLEDLQALQGEMNALQGQADADEMVAIIVLALIAAALGAGASAFYAVRLARPLEALARATRAIASGNLAARTLTGANEAREIADLSNDFNAMAASLQAFDHEYRSSAAAIAHELRTPLTILRGRLQGLLDGVFPVGGASISGLIVQVEQLSRIVEDLRTISLSSMGRLTVVRIDLDLSEMVETLSSDLHAHAGGADMRLELDLAHAPAWGDQQRLRQVVMALVDNAVRYGREGGVIRIETAAAHGSGFVRVLDRGPGLGEEAIARAFDRYWRGDESRSRDYGGAGLGLSVVRAIVDAHGGQARAFNREGGGAGFEIRIPVVGAQAHAESGPRPA